MNRLHALINRQIYSFTDKVWTVFGIDTLMTVLFTIAAWHSMASGWGDLRTLSELDWPFNALTGLSGLGQTLPNFHTFGLTY